MKAEIWQEKLKNSQLLCDELGGLLGPRVVRVSGTAETDRASGKPSVWPPVPSDLSIGSYICSS